MIPRPDASEYLAYYSRYIDLVPDGDLLATLRAQLDDTLALVRGLSEEQGGHRYAPGKWNIREVMNHVIDTERIFAYRAARLAERTLDLNRQRLQLAQEQYRVGGLTQNDLTDAVERAARAERDGLRARFEFTTALATLEERAGGPVRP